MVAGKAKPHKVTRLIVWLVSVVGVLGILGSASMAGIIFAGIFLARASYLLAMSFKYGTGGASKLDKACLAIGLAAIVVYALTGSGLWAVLLGILADLIGYVPTLVKTWRKPDSEDPTFFALEGVASLFAILAIGELRVDILLPVYFALSAFGVVLLIYRKRFLARVLAVRKQ